MQQANGNDRNSVEILPGDGKEWLELAARDAKDETPHEFLLMEGNLGIPQKILYRAYLEAAPAFKQALNVLSESSVTPSGFIDSSHAAALAESTAVLLVLNPGHQSAWNSRKRLVECGYIDLTRELSLTTALLTVRECAKHSILWHHRRWLLRRLYLPHTILSHAQDEIITDEDSLQSLDISTSRFRAEFDACMLAATTYERNYFAWTHRTRCLDALTSLLHNTATRTQELLELLHEEKINVTLWIDRHVADYTAMQYHCRLASLALALNPPPSLTSTATYEHAKSLVEAYPEHESLWYYLRGSVWAEGISAPEGCSWVESISQAKPEADSSTEVGLRHAQRCLNWLARQ